MEALMSEAPSRTSPLVVIAAIAVIIFSVVGVGVMTGYIPSSSSKTEENVAPGLPGDSNAQMQAPQPSPEKKSATTAHRKAPAGQAPRRTAAGEPAQIASAPRVCASCGKVEAVHAIEQKGEGTGLGAVAGGVIGGIRGNQVGSGRGRTAATVVGAGAGAYAGNEAEKYVKKTQHYDVIVRLEDGTSRTFTYQTEPAFRAGDKVRI